MPSDIAQSHLSLVEARAQLRTSALINASVGLVLLVIGALILAHQLGLSGWTLTKSGAVYVITLVCLHGYLALHLPRARLFPANQVTLLRLGLTALLAGWVGEGLETDRWLPALTAGLILTLDGLDGWLARRGGWASPFGARFDMETDALLVLVLAALIWTQDKAGPWILMAGLARYLLIGAGRMWPWLASPLPPSRRRQTLCVLLVLTLLLMLTPPIEPPLSLALAALAMALVGYSFGVDILWLWRDRSNAANRRQGHPCRGAQPEHPDRARAITSTAGKREG